MEEFKEEKVVITLKVDEEDAVRILSYIKNSYNRSIYGLKDRDILTISSTIPPTENEMQEFGEDFERDILCNVYNKLIELDTEFGKNKFIDRLIQKVQSDLFIYNLRVITLEEYCELRGNVSGRI